MRLVQLGFPEVYDYVLGKRGWLADGMFCEGDPPGAPVAGQHLSEVPTCYFRDPVRTVRERLSDAGECVAVDDGGVVVGRFLLDEEGAPAGAAEVTEEATVEDVMAPGPTTVRADEPLAQLAHRMHHAGVPDILVTDSAGRLLGLLELERAERAIEEAGIGLHEER